MNCYSLLLALLLPLGGISQTQFVSFHKHKSQIWVQEECTLLLLAFEVADAYHIQAHQQVQDQFIPTQILLEGQDQFEIEEIIFPQPYQIELAKKLKLLVLDGSFNIVVQLKSVPCFPQERPSFAGMLSYQACDDRKCFFPRELRFEL